MWVTLVAIGPLDLCHLKGLTIASEAAKICESGGGGADTVLTAVGSLWLRWTGAERWAVQAAVLLCGGQCSGQCSDDIIVPVQVTCGGGTTAGGVVGLITGVEGGAVRRRGSMFTMLLL